MNDQKCNRGLKDFKGERETVLDHLHFLFYLQLSVVLYSQQTGPNNNIVCANERETLKESEREYVCLCGGICEGLKESRVKKREKSREGGEKEKKNP